MASQVRVLQRAEGHVVAGSTCSAASISTTTGNLLVAIVETATLTNPCTGVKNAAGVSFTQIGSAVANSGGQLAMFYLKNITGNVADAVQATWGSAPLNPFIHVWEVENADPTSPLLTFATGSGSGSVQATNFNVTDDCIVMVGASSYSTGAHYIESASSHGVIFDNPAVLCATGTGTGCAGHTCFAGNNSGISLGVNPQDASPTSIIVAAFKAAAGKGCQLNVVCQGDSITAGYLVTTPWTLSLSLNLRSQVYNAGLISETLATMVSNAATVVDSKFRANMKNICVIWGGTNDFVVNGSSVATVEGLLSTYIAGRQAAGFKVVSVPMLDRANGAYSSSQAPYNSWMAGLPSGLDAVVSLPSTLLSSGASASSTYFVDQVHPTQLSNDTIEAPDISAAINGIAPLGFPFSDAFIS
jgi:hypothetical protein